MAIYNPLTGRKRRLPVKNTSRKKRSGALDATNRQQIRSILNQKDDCFYNAVQSLGLSMTTFLGWVIASMAGNQMQQQQCQNLLRQIMVYHHAQMFFHTTYQSLYNYIGDIPPNEDIRPTFTTMRNGRYRRISSFVNDDEARAFTNFDKCQLRRLLHHFAIPVIVMSTNYRFHQDEILLYGLIKLESGHTYKQLSDKTFHDSEVRISEGVRYFLQYIDERYYNLVGPRGLERWSDMIPRFAERIRTRVVEGRLWYCSDTSTLTARPGAWFVPGEFAVFGFMDCKNFKGTRTGSGPKNEEYESEWIGTSRRPNWYTKQRAMYTGSKRIHGVKLMSVVLPNGITGAVFGPCSVRRHDLTLLNWSDIGRIIFNFQSIHMGLQPNQMYSLFGDSAFMTAGQYTCIKKRHEPVGHVPLTPRELLENEAMKRVREPVEWPYGSITMLWAESTSWQNRKLEMSSDYICRSIRVTTLLTNCYNILHGSDVSTYFRCREDVPSLDDYLGSI